MKGTHRKVCLVSCLLSQWLIPPQVLFLPLNQPIQAKKSKPDFFPGITTISGDAPKCTIPSFEIHQSFHREVSNSNESSSAVTTIIDYHESIHQPPLSEFNSLVVSGHKNIVESTNHLLILVNNHTCRKPP